MSLYTDLRSTGYNIETALALNFPGGYTKDGSVDYTTTIQGVLNTQLNVVFPPFPLLVNVETNRTALRLMSNQNILFLPGSRIKLAPRIAPDLQGDYSIIRVDDKSNINIINPVIEGDKQNYTVYYTATDEPQGSTVAGTATYNKVLLAGYSNEYSIVIKIGGVVVMTDNGIGNLVGSAGWTGTITYHTGTLSFTKTGTITAGQAITISYQVSPGEYGMGIRLLSCTNVNIINPNITECWGDGIILTHNSSVPCHNVNIYGGRLVKNGRDAISVISTTKFSMYGTYMAGSNNKLPRAGINFEPNGTGDDIENCKMVGCITEENNSAGVQLGLAKWYSGGTPMPKVVGLTVINHVDKHSKYGLYQSHSRSGREDALTTISGEVVYKNFVFYRTPETLNYTPANNPNIPPIRTSYMETVVNNPGIMTTFIDPEIHVVDDGVDTQLSDADVNARILAKYPDTEVDIQFN